MIKTILITLLVSSCAMAKGIEPDKKQHLAVSFGAGVLGYVVLKKTGMKDHEAAIGSLIAVTIAGLLKESSDDFVDNKDILANTIGSGLAIGAMYSMEF